MTKMLSKGWDLLKSNLAAILEYLKNPAKIWGALVDLFTSSSTKAANRLSEMQNVLTQFKNGRSNDALVAQLTRRKSTEEEITEAKEAVAIINQYSDRNYGGMGCLLRNRVDASPPVEGVKAIKKLNRVWSWKKFMTMQPIASSPSEDNPTGMSLPVWAAFDDYHTAWLRDLYTQNRNEAGYSACQVLWSAYDGLFKKKSGRDSREKDAGKQLFSRAHEFFKKTYNYELSDDMTTLGSMDLFVLENVVDIRNDIDHWINIVKATEPKGMFSVSAEKWIQGQLRMRVDRARCSLRAALYAVDMPQERRRRKDQKREQNRIAFDLSKAYRFRDLSPQAIDETKEKVKSYFSRPHVQDALWAQYADLKQLSYDLSTTDGYTKGWEWSYKPEFLDMLKKTLGLFGSK